MTKFQPIRKTLRTKTQILNDFEEYLLEHNIITLTEKGTFTETELEDLLNDMLYDVEEVKGIQCSTLKAWHLWINVILKYEPTSGKLLWNEFVKDSFLDLERNRYICILASRGLGKSFMLYCLYSLFKMYLYEYTKIFIASNVPTMCKRNIRETKRMIDGNELLLNKKAIHKKRDLLWSQDKFEYNEGTIETGSVGSNVRSAHVNYVFVDDILRDDMKYSSQEINNFIFGQLFPIAQRHKARFAIAGTPISLQDLYHDVMNSQANFQGKRLGNGEISHRGFYCKEYRIIKDWDKKIIYLPELFSWWELADEKNSQSMINTQGEAKFMREYMLVCTDENTSMFSEKLITQCSERAGQYKFLYNGEEGKYYIIGGDVATAGEASSDSSAFVALEVLKTDKGIIKIIRHLTVEKGMPITGLKSEDGQVIDVGQVDSLKELSSRFNHAVCIVEKNNVGVSLIQELQKRNVPVDEFVTTKSSKENMIRYLISEMKSGNLFFCEDTPEIKYLKRELMNFGVHRSKTGKETMRALSGHDDCVIALAIANYAASFMDSVSSVVGVDIY